MDQTSFQHILDLIKDDPVFCNQNRRPQRPVQHQLAVYLIRMGRTQALKTSNVAGVAEGTLYKYCNRVSKAIRCLKRGHLAWPGHQRRRIIKRTFAAKGFPGCIGMCDGSLIRLGTKPKESGKSYWCRKKMYAVSSFSHTFHIFMLTYGIVDYSAHSRWGWYHHRL
jgi:hypothetical protein